MSSLPGYAHEQITPHITYSVSDWRVQSMPSAFAPLTDEEVDQEWGKEYKIGQALAKQLDLYRAITAFKRSEILTPKGHEDRKVEIQYLILLSYYLGEKYEEVIDTFSRSKLTQIDSSFAAYQDLLVILYESYQKLEQFDEANQILTLIELENESNANRLKLSKAMSEGDLYQLEPASYTPQLKNDNKELLNYYNTHKKSVAKAQWLNLIPGAGYLYLGQKQTAFTSFLLNSLCIAATTTLFMKKHYAAGAIMAGFEAGWYMGGIYGAGRAAKTYNERLYESGARQVMRKNELFPVLTLQYAF